jgi:hypothetical protein
VSQILFWGFLTLLCGGMVWAIAKIAEATGEARALREKAEKDAEDAKKASAVIAQNRSPDDTAGRLQRGDF